MCTFYRGTDCDVSLRSPFLLPLKSIYPCSLRLRIYSKYCSTKSGSRVTWDFGKLSLSPWLLRNTWPIPSTKSHISLNSFIFLFSPPFGGLCQITPNSETPFSALPWPCARAQCSSNQRLDSSMVNWLYHRCSHVKHRPKSIHLGLLSRILWYGLFGAFI